MGLGYRSMDFFKGTKEESDICDSLIDLSVVYEMEKKNVVMDRYCLFLFLYHWYYLG